MTVRRPQPTSSAHPPTSRLLTVVATVGLLVLGVLATTPADAATTRRVLLKNGAAVVGYTYTAVLDGDWPTGSDIRYQWYRGDKDATTSSFVPIPGAESQKYTMTDDDHFKTVKVVVQVMNGSTLLAEKDSAASNYILWRMTPPALSGVPHVGELITASVGRWYQDWDTTLTWRNTGIPVPGENGLTYRARPRDAGKEISLLALGEYDYPNGVHPIDRYASRMRISWATRSILRGASRSRGVLRLTAIAYAAGAKQSTVHGHVTLYDGNRILKQLWLPHGRRLLTFRHLSAGVHRITMSFDKNPWFDGSSSSRSFRVR